MPILPVIPATPGQIEQIEDIAMRGVVRKAARRLRLDIEGAHALLARENVASVVLDAVAEVLGRLSFPNDFTSEEGQTNCDYGAQYAIRPLSEQIVELVKHFPQLKVDETEKFSAEVLPTLTLPQGAEGWFAIPRWKKIAQTYGEAVELMLAAITSTRALKNYREGQLGPDRFRQSGRTVRMLARIAEWQLGDILIVPAQFGERHAGRSVRRARVVFTANEFGLGAFASGCMLLVHPERIVKPDDLLVDCPGDEFNHPDSKTPWFAAPAFGGGRTLKFGADFVDGVRDSGPVSGFLP